MANNLTKDKLQKLVDDVSASLADVLAKSETSNTEVAKEAGEKLAKATPGNETASEQVPPGSSTESSAEESSSPAPEGTEDTSAKPAEAPAKEAEATTEIPPAEATTEAAPTQDPAQDAGGSIDSLQAEYAALPIEELKMHMIACKAALMTQMAEGDNSAAEAAPPVGAEQAAPDASASTEAAPPVTAAPEGTPPMAKSEDKELIERIAKLEKSNEELSKSVKDKDDLLAGFGTIVQKLNERISTRKSVANISAVTKPGTELAKSEGSVDISNLSFDQIKTELNAITTNGKLSKSDQTAVISFIAGNDKDPKKIAHLLKKN